LTRNVVTQAGSYGIGISELLRSLQELER